MNNEQCENCENELEQRNCCCDNNNDKNHCHDNARREMLMRIKEYRFALVELNLYLNTHPDDTKALCLHNNYSRMLRDLETQYQKVYEPLTANYPCRKWRWLEEPWPWERGDYVIMWDYKKLLQYPVDIKKPDPRLAKVIISQYGGPDGELAASLRYLSQRFGMPDQKAKAILNDIGTEELAHLEMVGTLVKQLTEDVCPEDLEKAGLGPYYTDHGNGVYPQSAGDVPFTAAYIAVKGDPIADLQEDLAAEQKARATYEKLIDLSKDNPDVVDVLKFLRQREVVHFQRFGEALRGVQEKLAEKKFYMNNTNMNANPITVSLTDDMMMGCNNKMMNYNKNMMNHHNNCGCGR